jgi:hypothetical protein
MKKEGKTEKEAQKEKWKNAQLSRPNSVVHVTTRHVVQKYRQFHVTSDKAPDS